MLKGLTTQGEGTAAGLRAMLRAATARDHARLDKMAAGLDVSRPDGYRAFLLWHARVLPVLEERLGMMPELPDWAERRRAAALMDDLSALDLKVPAPCRAPPLLNGPERIGALYVLEGSRLGAAVLARRVESGQPHAPRAFLTHGRDAQLWRHFLIWLEEQHIAEEAVPDMIAGARATFAAYTQALAV